MNKFVTLVVSGTLVFGLGVGVSGCTPGNNVPGATFAGASAGGLLGAAVFRGDQAWIGALGGALVGGIIGNRIGNHMDRQDEINMQRAVVSTPVGQEASWHNDRRDVTYTVKPVRNYHRKGRYCREYQTRIKIQGKWHTAFGKACRMPDGTWKVVK